MDHATIDSALDHNFRSLMLDPTARQAMCWASQGGVRDLWALRRDADVRIVLRFHMKVLKLGRHLDAA